MSRGSSRFLIAETHATGGVKVGGTVGVVCGIVGVIGVVGIHHPPPQLAGGMTGGVEVVSVIFTVTGALLQFVGLTRSHIW